MVKYQLEMQAKESLPWEPYCGTVMLYGVRNALGKSAKPLEIQSLERARSLRDELTKTYGGWRKFRIIRITREVIT